MLQSLEPADHGLDTRTDLLVAIEKRGPLPRERLVALLERTVLLLEVLHGFGEFVDAFFEALELEIELRRFRVAHLKNYKAALLARSMCAIAAGFAPRGPRSHFGHNRRFMVPASDYSEIQRALADAHSLADAAEAHGTLAGSLCAAGGYRFEDWLAEILPEGEAGREATDALRGLFEQTAVALGGLDMEFAPLLPHDEEPLDARATALGQWCQGFLYGLGSSSLSDIKGLPGDVGEVVRDLSEITQVGVDAEEGLESNEGAYAELVEFVRVGVQLVFDELEPLRDAPPQPGAEGSLH